MATRIGNATRMESSPHGPVIHTDDSGILVFQRDSGYVGYDPETGYGMTVVNGQNTISAGNVQQLARGRVGYGRTARRSGFISTFAATVDGLYAD